MHFTPILALAGKTSTSVMDAVPHLVGMLMVIASLAILWGICVLTAKLIQILVPQLKSTAVPITTPPAKNTLISQPAATPAGIPQEIVAVIAATVATVTGQSHRIISIKPMSSSWERAGRQSVLTSHRIR